MYYAINTPNFGIYSDPRLMAELAHEAEESGWDGFFIWDHIGAGWSVAIADPWIELAAMAMTTKRIKLGPVVTPLPRRRPWKVARETVTLDLLTNGRLILGVGIGSDSGREYSCYHEATDDKQHGAMLDEALDVIIRLWSGEKCSYQGIYYQLEDAHFLPVPIQRPRIPIWVSGVWPNKKPFRRAARWDGIVPIVANGNLSAEQFRDMMAYLRNYREGQTEFAAVASGRTTGTDTAKDRDTVMAYSEAGATWWQEGMDWNDSLEQVHKRIRLGPPR